MNMALRFSTAGLATTHRALLVPAALTTSRAYASHAHAASDWQSGPPAPVKALKSHLHHASSAAVALAAAAWMSTSASAASAFSLPPLPYPYDALEPYIDAKTMELHHTKHHQTYVNTLNGALDKAPELKSMSLEELNQKVGTSAIPKEVQTVVRNHGGGHWNHSFFWKVMAPPGKTKTTGPSDELATAIDSAFGSLDAAKEKFNAAATTRFGSGWAWLGVKDDGKLIITSTANQDNPLQTAIVEESAIPILGLDVWEHAYYLKYQWQRPAYINNWWNVVNWDQVNENYEVAKQGKVPKVVE